MTVPTEKRSLMGKLKTFRRSNTIGAGENLPDFVKTKPRGIAPRRTKSLGDSAARLLKEGESSRRSSESKKKHSQSRSQAEFVADAVGKMDPFRMIEMLELYANTDNDRAHQIFQGVKESPRAA